MCHIIFIMKGKKGRAILSSLLAALCYSINIPLSKLLLDYVEPCMLAGFLYLGAGISTGVFSLFRKKERKGSEKLKRKDFPFVTGMILLDIAAPVLMMVGLKNTSASVSTLINNFEIVATSLIASLVFHESISKRGWVAITLITVSTVILSFSFEEKVTISPGVILIVLATISWGFENNCTRMLSSRDTFEIVFLKGMFSGTGSIIIAFLKGESFPPLRYMFYIFMLGTVAYGLSLLLYIRAQNIIGAGRTSSFYAINPFLGSVLSFLILNESLSRRYFIALLIMAFGTLMMVRETLKAK